ncbi:MAG: 16S rRNA (cytosine(967)-C(5))-methyltransferase RsmB [Ruminococcaceae bacterium]|nr:16S rRNA (cytosine(967)-C(5))-methyltransferase RsmB [Oscillospiraceae bacterium]
MKNETNPRAAAAASLLSWEKNGRFANLEVNASLNASALSDADRGLYTALVYGVIERAITLDYIIGTLSARPAEQIDRETRCALRLGLYQLTFMDRIPPHAAVSESVNTAPARSRGFVNALLRTYQRGGCRYALPEGELLSRMEIEYSAPKELCAFFVERYGEETAKALLSSANQSPPVTLRPNPLRTTAEEILTRHAADGARVCTLSPDMIEIDGAAGVSDGIAEGLYFVQDPASRLCVRALDAHPGETVIDTCAAPGGKSISTALDMNNSGRLISFDLHENKLSLIRRTAGSLGITILETAARDAREPDPALIGKADRVLCDAPCSGLGVIRKKPDIRYKSLESVAALPAIQYDILCGAAQYVRPGGVLVYSTCTLNPDENEHIVRRFLENHGDFSPVDFDLGPAGVSENGMRTFFPHLDGCDGFFIAKMIRKTT